MRDSIYQVLLSTGVEAKIELFAGCSPTLRKDLLLCTNSTRDITKLVNQLADELQGVDPRSINSIRYERDIEGTPVYGRLECYSPTESKWISGLLFPFPTPDEKVLATIGNPSGTKNRIKLAGNSVKLLEEEHVQVVLVEDPYPYLKVIDLHPEKKLVTLNGKYFTEQALHYGDKLSIGRNPITFRKCRMEKSQKSKEPCLAAQLRRMAAEKMQVVQLATSLQGKETSGEPVSSSTRNLIYQTFKAIQEAVLGQLDCYLAKRDPFTQPNKKTKLS